MSNENKLVKLSDLGAVAAELEAEITALDNGKADAIVDTASGAIASFPDGADGLPLKKLIVNIEPVQAGSGDPSPTNVRPISGWTGANVANVGDSEKQKYFAGLLNGTYGVVDLGTLTWVKNNTLMRTDGPLQNVKTPSSISVVPNSCTPIYTTVAYENLAGNDKTVTIIFTDSFYKGEIWVHDETYTDAATFKAAMSGVYLIYELATPTTPTITKEQFDTLLEEFGIVGWLVPITFPSPDPGTVYGGTLDVTSGVLTVTHNYLTDNGSLNWAMNPDGSFYTANPSAVALQDKSGCMCNYAPFSIDFGGLNVFFRTNGLISLGRGWGSVYPSVQALKSAFSSVPIQFVYKLATPQTYQLDPVTVSTLLGQNNIWADCGPSTVEYPCDTKLYIQKINTPTDDDMIADANIASGKYFIVNNNLYLSTTAILAGDPIKPGTNCTLTNLAAALNALNS